MKQRKSETTERCEKVKLRNNEMDNNERAMRNNESAMRKTKMRKSEAAKESNRRFQ